MPKTSATMFAASTRFRVAAILGAFLVALAIVAPSVAPLAAHASTPSVGYSHAADPEIRTDEAQVSTASSQDPESEEGPAPEKFPIEVEARISDDGLVHVKESFTWSEPTPQGSFVRALPLFMPRTESTWRRFEYFQFSAQSDGQPLKLVVKDDASQLLATLTQHVDADPKKSESPQETATPLSVTLSYVVRGATTVRSPSNPETAEFFWSPLASGGTERTDLDFTISAEQQALSIECSVIVDDSSMLGWADILDAEESQEENADEPLGSCKERASNGTVSATNLGRLSTVIVRAHYPKFTFAYDSAIQVDEPTAKDPSDSAEPTPEDTFDPTWAENIDLNMDQGSGIVTQVIAGVSLGAVIAAMWLLWRRKPDYTYPGLAPGDVAEAEKMQTHNRAMYPRAPLAGTKKVSKQLHGVEPTQALQELSRNQYGSLYSLELNFQQVLVTLIDLADRGHLTITRNAPDQQHGHSTPALWVLEQTGGADPLNASEASLINDLFATGNRIEVQSLHSSFAPDLLEALTLIGEESKSEQLTTRPVKLAAIKTAKKIQRTPLGRAYAEQLAGLRDLFSEQSTGDSPQRFVGLLSAAFALGCENDWVRHMATPSFEVPAWYHQSEVDDITPSEFVDQLRALLA